MKTKDKSNKIQKVQTFDDISKEQKAELDFRYQHFLKNKHDYKDWDKIKNNS